MPALGAGASVSHCPCTCETFMWSGLPKSPQSSAPLMPQRSVCEQAQPCHIPRKGRQLEFRALSLKEAIGVLSGAESRGAKEA